jgi:membrane protease YdiL (CAAX protease family)
LEDGETGSIRPRSAFLLCGIVPSLFREAITGSSIYVKLRREKPRMFGKNLPGSRDSGMINYLAADMGASKMRQLFSPALRSTWYFLALAYIFSWLCWLPVVLSRQNAINTPFLLLYVLGGFGPSAAGLFTAWRENGRAGLRALLRRGLELRFAGMWWAVIVLIWPLILGLAAFIASRVGSSPYPYSPLWKLIAAQPLLILPQILVALVGGPLSEEFGWRGYAQEHLQENLGKLGASLWLGLFWGAWHYPLFYMVGTTQSNISATLFLANTFPLAVIFTQVYNGTGRKLGAAILLHFMFNFSLGFVPLLDPVTFASLVGVTFGIALIIVIRWLTQR